MQEKKVPVFVVATGDTYSLPPELQEGALMRSSSWIYPQRTNAARYSRSPAETAQDTRRL
jgi:type IV secretory pathway VirB9-like protein